MRFAHLFVDLRGSEPGEAWLCVRPVRPTTSPRSVRSVRPLPEVPERLSAFPKEIDVSVTAPGDEIGRAHV